MKRTIIAACALCAPIWTAAQMPLGGPAGSTYGLGYPFPDHAASWSYGWDYGPPVSHHPWSSGPGWSNWNRPAGGNLTPYAPQTPAHERFKSLRDLGLGGLIGRQR